MNVTSIPAPCEFFVSALPLLNVADHLIGVVDQALSVTGLTRRRSREKSRAKTPKVASTKDSTSVGTQRTSKPKLSTSPPPK